MEKTVLERCTVARVRRVDQVPDVGHPEGDHRDVPGRPRVPRGTSWTGAFGDERRTAPPREQAGRAAAAGSSRRAGKRGPQAERDGERDQRGHRFEEDTVEREHHGSHGENQGGRQQDEKRVAEPDYVDGDPCGEQRHEDARQELEFGDAVHPGPSGQPRANKPPLPGRTERLERPVTGE